MRLPFGQYMPDLPAHGNPGLVVASGALPGPTGYRPMPSLVVRGDPALAARARGAIGVVDANGDGYNFAGDETTLYKLGTSGLEDVSKVGGYACAGTSRWEFAHFGSYVIACNPGDSTQYYELGTSTDFADISGAPRARHVGVIRSHVVLGNLYDAVNGDVPNSVWWPAVDNPLSWPTPGTDAAIAVQSGRQVLQGAGGWVMAVVGGSEVGAIFQQRAIWRMDYVGGDVMYSFNRVEPNRGLLIPGLAVPFGREVLYVAEDGVYRFNYTASVPVGEERVNRAFLADLDQENLHRVVGVPASNMPVIFILYPGSGNSLGTPNRCLAYNWALDRFATIDMEAELIFNVVQEAPHLDSDPDDILDDPALGDLSFDDTVGDAGRLRLGGFNASHQVAEFSGESMAAAFETGDVELLPGRRTLVRFARPLVTGAATVAVGGKAQSNATIVLGSAASQNGDGRCPLRSNARFHRFRVEIPPGWSGDAVGLDLDAAVLGAR